MPREGEEGEHPLVVKVAAGALGAAAGFAGPDAAVAGAGLAPVIEDVLGQLLVWAIAQTDYSEFRKPLSIRPPHTPNANYLLAEIIRDSSRSKRISTISALLAAPGYLAGCRLRWP